MRKRLIHMFVVAGLLSATSCYKDDFDGLQKQVDGIEKQVTENTKSIEEQKEEILGQISALQTDIKLLQEEDAKLSEELSEVSGDLKVIKEDVESNSNLVYYGNLVNDEDYAAYKEAKADVVTGKVVVRSIEDAAAISNCRWIGSNLISHVGELEGIQNIGGDLIIDTKSTEVVVNGLFSVGGKFTAPVNAEMTNLSIDDLVIIAEDFTLLEGNIKLVELSFAKLELVGGNININNTDNNNTSGVGVLNDINLNGVAVGGNLTISSLGANMTSVGKTLTFGNVSGDINIDNCGIETVEINSEKINGDLLLDHNTIKTFDITNVVDIAGNITLTSNYVSEFDQGTGSNVVKGLENINATSLETVSGSVVLNDNRKLFDIFNNVKTVEGKISLNFNSEKDNFIVFEELTTVNDMIEIYGQTYTFKGFNKLTTVAESKNILLGAGDRKFFIVYSDDEDAFEVFNSLEESKGDVRVNLYYHNYIGTKKYLDFGHSFASLTKAKTVSLYMTTKTNQFVNGFIALEELETLNVNGEKNKSFPVDFSDSFSNLNLVTSSIKLNNNFDSFKGLNVKSVENIKFGYKAVISEISLPELETITAKYGITFYNYGTSTTLNFPKLSSVGKFKFQNKVAGGDIVINAPALTTCLDLTLDFYSNAPTSINAPLSKLKNVDLLTVKFNKGIVDATNVLTGLEDLNATGTSAKLYYLEGQKFCGMDTFLNTVDSGMLYLYNSGSLIADADEAAEIVKLTDCN